MTLAFSAPPSPLKMTCQLAAAFGNLKTDRRILRLVQKNSWVMDQGAKKKLRCARRLRRRHHCDKGSHAPWCIDLYFKLKQYGIAINASSRYVVWMEAKQATAPK